MPATCDAVVIGAGPYGLSIAAHLRSCGVEVHVFGRPMSFWEEHMPVGMLLRSSWRASSISDPTGDFTLDRYRAAAGQPAPRPVPLDYFVEYGHWYRENLVPDVDQRRIAQLALNGSGFVVDTDDGERCSAHRVIVATGIAEFAWTPPQLRRLPPSVVSHSSRVRDVASFAGRSVLVVGAGQSAIECAALMSEAGAAVEVLVRAPEVGWTEGRGDPHSRRRRLVQRIKYAPTDVGPPLVSWIAATPDVLRRLPRRLQADISTTCLVPLGAQWLRSRVVDVTFSRGREIRSASLHGARVKVDLSDGTTRTVDHLVAATGYRADLDRLEFIAPAIRSSLLRMNGFPILGDGLESSIPGLYFAGLAARYSFGPVMCFVVGSAYAAPAIARHLTGKIPAVVSFAF
jgi:cation diffusion facilitator CzcD-associated flavoprotein CzcO